MNEVKKHLTVGPGGCSCPCSFTAPGSKERKAEFRRAKRRSEREAMKREEKAN